MEYTLAMGDNDLDGMTCTAGAVGRGSIKEVPLRDGVNFILSSMDRDELPSDVHLPGEDLEAGPEEETAAPAMEIKTAESEETETAPNGLPVTAWMNRRKEPDPEPEAGDDGGDIPSWPIGSQEWMGSFSKASLDSMEKMKRDWKLNGKPRVPIFVGDRIFLNMQMAAKGSDLNYESLRTTMRLRKAVYKGISIGYAVPAIDAIRRGLTREEFAAEIREIDGPPAEPPAVDPGPAKPQPSAADAKPVNGVSMGEMIAAAGEREKTEAAKPKVIASLVEGPDGKIRLDRSLDFETAQRVLDYYREAGQTAPRVSL